MFRNNESESPLIDLTAAFNAGETFITVSGDFSHYYIGGYLAVEFFELNDVDKTLSVSTGCAKQSLEYSKQVSRYLQTTGMIEQAGSILPIEPDLSSPPQSAAGWGLAWRGRTGPKLRSRSLSSKSYLALHGKVIPLSRSNAKK